MGALLAPPARTREEAIERALGGYRVIGSPGLPARRGRRARARAAARSTAPTTRPASGRQLVAILASGDRTERAAAAQRADAGDPRRGRPARGAQRRRGDRRRDPRRRAACCSTAWATTSRGPCGRSWSSGSPRTWRAPNQPHAACRAGGLRNTSPRELARARPAGARAAGRAPARARRGASTRARCIPMHTCGPPANARWRRALGRSRSKRSGSGNVSGSRLAAVIEIAHEVAGGDRRAAELTSRGGVAVDHRGGGLEPQRLLDGGGQQRGVGAHPRERVGVLEQVRRSRWRSSPRSSRCRRTAARRRWRPPRRRSSPAVVTPQRGPRARLAQLLDRRAPAAGPGGRPALRRSPRRRSPRTSRARVGGGVIEPERARDHGGGQRAGEPGPQLGLAGAARARRAAARSRRRTAAASARARRRGGTGP